MFLESIGYSTKHREKALFLQQNCFNEGFGGNSSRN